MAGRMAQRQLLRLDVKMGPNQLGPSEARQFQVHGTCHHNHLVLVPQQPPLLARLHLDSCTVNYWHCGKIVGLA